MPAATASPGLACVVGTFRIEIPSGPEAITSVKVPPISIPTLMPCAMPSPHASMHGCCRRTNHLSDPVLLRGCGDENKAVARTTAAYASRITLTVRRRTSNIEAGGDALLARGLRQPSDPRRLGSENVPGHINLFHALLAYLSLGGIARQVRMPGLAQTIDNLLDGSQVCIRRDPHAKHLQGIRTRARHLLVPTRACAGGRAPNRRGLASRGCRPRHRWLTPRLTDRDPGYIAIWANASSTTPDQHRDDGGEGEKH